MSDHRTKLNRETQKSAAAHHKSLLELHPNSLLTTNSLTDSDCVCSRTDATAVFIAKLLGCGMSYWFGYVDLCTYSA